MKIFLQKYRKNAILPIVLAICGFLYFFLFQEPSTTPQVELIDSSQITEQQLNNDKVTATVQDSMKEAAPTSVVVDVKGAVARPGVYQLRADERVIDAITMAGSYLKDADTRLINHAQKLQDEMVIYIPLKGEVVAEVEHGLVTTSSQSTNDDDGIVNINTADEAMFMTLPGIGPSKAKAILTYREEQGSFATIEDLKNVSGIGDKTFERLQPLIKTN